METPLAPPFVWGYFMVHGAFGPWPFPVGYGKVLSADVAALLVAQGERVPLEHATDCLAANLTQGQCVKGTYVAAPTTTSACSSRPTRTNVSTTGASTSRSPPWRARARTRRRAGR